MASVVSRWALSIGVASGTSGWFTLICLLLASTQGLHVSVNVDLSASSRHLPHFWASTGFSPPANGETARMFLGSESVTRNLNVIGATPNKAVRQVRVHWLLDLIEAKSLGNNLKWDYQRLDGFLDRVVASGFRPRFELMGNPGNVFRNLSDEAEATLWKEMVKSVVERCAVRFGPEKVSKWTFETWNEPDLGQYNTINMTLAGYLSYFRATASALRDVGKVFAVNFSLASPAGLFKRRDKHPLCWGLLKYCNNLAKGNDRFLLEEWTSKPINVDIITASGKTALHQAAQFARCEAVALLLEKGANPRALKQADWTPLMLVCTKTGEEALKCCKFLYEAGGSSVLTDRNKDGWTVLHIAAREGDTEIVKWILSLESNLCASRSKNGRTPLHTAALHGHVDVVVLLLHSGSTGPNMPDSCGSTPVHDAVRSGCINTLTALTARGGDVKLTNALGQSVIHMAAETGDTEMLEYLLEKCALPSDFGTFTSTPLQCAIKAGKADAVRTLLQHNANIQALDSCGYSCLDIANASKCSTTQDLIKEAFSNGYQIQT